MADNPREIEAPRDVMGLRRGCLGGICVRDVSAVNIGQYNKWEGE